MEENLGRHSPKPYSFKGEAQRESLKLWCVQMNGGIRNTKKKKGTGNATTQDQESTQISSGIARHVAGRLDIKTLICIASARIVEHI